jgi:hypothetical protein
MKDFAIDDITIVVTDTSGKYIKEIHAKDLSDETIHAIMEDIANASSLPQIVTRKTQFTKAEDFLS